VRRIGLILIFFVSGILLHSKEKSLLIADFNLKKKVNSIGGEFGAWLKDPSDKTQFCREFFKKEDKGYSLGLEYDVDSENPAYNGLWMKLKGIDISKYNVLFFKIRGDLKKGFTTRFYLELKNSKKETGRVLVTGISEYWKEIKIPLFLFTMHPDYAKPLSDFKDIEEMVITFDDKTVTRKTGTIYIDDVKFLKTKKKIKEVIIDDFNDKDFVSNLGGKEGTWSVNPDDKTQFCKVSFLEDSPDKSSSLVLDYDVSSEFTYDKYHPYTAYNGYYIKMNNIRIKGNRIFLCFYTKGTTPQFKLEVKTDKKVYKFKVKGIKNKWEEKEFFLVKKKGEKYFGPIKEITFVFNSDVKDKKGRIFIDDLKFKIK